MRLNSGILAVLIISLFALGIGGTMAFNLWHTESSKNPVLIKEGEFAGLPNPSDIRGSYTLEDISNAFNIPINDLAQAFGVSENKAAFQVKQLEEIYENTLKDFEIGTDSVRLFTALYLGLPHTAESTTALPQTALDLLVAKNKINDIKAAEFQKISFDLTNIQKQDSETSNTHDSTLEDRTIKGKTTFYDLISWGVSQREIEEVVGEKIVSGSTTIRDWAMKKNLEFLDYKEKLQQLVDKTEP